MEKRNIFHNESGQLTIVGLLLMFLVLITTGALISPILTEVTDISAALVASACSTCLEAATVIGFYPLFLMVVILATLAMYGGPRVA